MEDPAPRCDETICWQCGAPADPACALVVDLAARRLGHDGLGYPVVQGRRHETLKLPIPLCRACRKRNDRVGFCAAGGAVIGIVAAGLASRWNGGWIFLGFFFGSLAVALGSVVYDRLSGRRILNRYPPLRRLLRTGWYYPGSA